MGRHQAWGLVGLRLCLGVFFLFMGLGKLAWFTSSGPLRESLTAWAEAGPALSRTYIQTVCLPGVEIFARVVPAAELATGLALLVGAYTRLAAALAMLMLLNFHVAMGIIFTYAYLTNGYGFPVLGGLFALALGGASLPMSVRK